MPRPPIDLRGLPIIITGASSGIGRATAVECARRGMPVVACARRRDRLDHLASEVASAGGGRCLPFVGDVADPDLGRRLADACEREFGRVYAVFANAGYGGELPLRDTSDEVLRAMFETNFFGTVTTIRPALERMLGSPEGGRGHVLICSSAIGKLGVPFYAAYCATKAAQSVLGRALRHEVGPLGVHVSTVHPVKTRTEFSDAAQRLTPDTVPHRRFPPMQSAERVARAIVACLRRPRAEVWTSWASRWAMGLATACPSLAERPLDAFARSRAR